MNPTPESIATRSPEQAAVVYVNEQLAQHQRRLRTTRLVTSLLVVALAGYAIGVTVWMHHNVLAPSAAADIATARVVELVQQAGPPLADQIVTEVPAALGTLPDMLLDQIPSYRLQLETQLEQTLASYAAEFEPEVEMFLDQFISENQDRLHLLLAAAADPNQTQKFGEEIEKELLGYLNATGTNGESAISLLEQGRLALDNVQERLHRLATAKDLSVEELKLRRVIAATLKAAETQ